MRLNPIPIMLVTALCLHFTAIAQDDWISEAKEKKVRSMREMLPDEVFKKWNEYYMRKENKAKRHL